MAAIAALVVVVVAVIAWMDSTKDQQLVRLLYTAYHMHGYPSQHNTSQDISIAYKYSSILSLSVRAKTQLNHKTWLSIVEPATNGIVN